MIAVILTGGLGTRLRPFTCDTPKPLLPVLNKPLLHYQFEILKKHGIKKVVLCTSYRSEVFHRALGDGRSLGLSLSYVTEKHPLGTGGALKNAEGLLRGHRTALALNGDILNALDISAFRSFHNGKRADLSISLTRVKDPTLYGLVKTGNDGRIHQFLEKPSWDEINSNTINAGAYLFETSLLDHIPPKTPYSLERSLFPLLLQRRRRLFSLVSGGYWIDIGTIENYLQAHLDILGGLAPFKPESSQKRGGLLLGRKVRLGKELTLTPADGRVMLGEKTCVEDFVRFSGRVCVGPRCIIGRGASLSDCVVLEGTRVGDGARLEKCVVGASCRIEVQAVVGPRAALAGGSRVKAFSQL
jgi:NDP-sugar pyrophosphorylase family protein